MGLGVLAQRMGGAGLAKGECTGEGDSEQATSRNRLTSPAGAKSAFGVGGGLEDRTRVGAKPPSTAGSWRPGLGRDPQSSY